MHVESRFVTLEDAELFEEDLKGKGFVLVDKITEDLQAGEYLKMGKDAPETFAVGGIIFVWKE